MITRANREEIFTILSADLEKEKAEELEKQLSVYFLEVYKAKLEGDRRYLEEADNLCSKEYGTEYGQGIKASYKLRKKLNTEEMIDVQNKIIEILK